MSLYLNIILQTGIVACKKKCHWSSLLVCGHYYGHMNVAVAENKLEGDVGDIISLQAQMSPYFQLREKFKCILVL